jgi:hypothetical protein
MGRFASTDCVAEQDSPWFEGPYGFAFEAPEPLTFHLCRGWRGLFEIGYPGLKGTPGGG